MSETGTPQNVGRNGDWTPLLDAQWDAAEGIVCDLYNNGILCGHPDRSDAHAVVMALFRAGILPLPEGVGDDDTRQANLAPQASSAGAEQGTGPSPEAPTSAKAGGDS